jgi:hypothetical protein
VPGTQKDEKDAARAMVPKVDGERAGGNAMRSIEKKKKERWIVDRSEQQRRWLRGRRIQIHNPEESSLLNAVNSFSYPFSFAFNFTLPAASV